MVEAESHSQYLLSAMTDLPRPHNFTRDGTFYLFLWFDYKIIISHQRAYCSVTNELKCI